MNDEATNPKAPADAVPIPGGLVGAGYAAAYLKCSEWTLAEWRCQGKGPRFVKLGNRVRYSLPALAEWVEAHTAASTSEHDARKAG